jgi:hypothetical protein|tara:strand:- start:180 stop:437 length:258 start_codon:yes stop_codon:yes gene_type:complete
MKLSNQKTLNSIRFNKIKALVPIYVFMGFSISCASIKEYEKVNINDPDMELSQRQICRFETNFQLYREGSSGANGGKVGGGCGCN